MERDIKPTYDELESYVENLQKQLADAQATIAALEETILKMGENAAVVAKDAMAAKEQVAALQAERDTARRRVDELEAREVDVVLLREDLEKRTAELEAAKAELEQERVRLASCLIAAEGGTKDIVKQGDYGWSPAYQATLNLQAELERVRAERDHAKKMEVVQKEVADNQTWHAQKLRTLILALPKVEGEIAVKRTEVDLSDVWGITLNGYFTFQSALFDGKEEAESYAAILKHRQGMEG